MIQRVVATALVIAVLAVAANDVVRYSRAQQRLRDTTYEVTRWAAENSAGRSRAEVAVDANALAGQRGVTVYQYDQGDRGVRVWTTTDVTGTIVAGPIVNMTQGVSPSEAWKAPFVIRDYREAGSE